MNIDLPSENAKQCFNRKFTSMKSGIIRTSNWKLYMCPGEIWRSVGCPVSLVWCL